MTKDDRFECRGCMYVGPSDDFSFVEIYEFNTWGDPGYAVYFRCPKCGSSKDIKRLEDSA